MNWPLRTLKVRSGLISGGVDREKRPVAEGTVKKHMEHILEKFASKAAVRRAFGRSRCSLRPRPGARLDGEVNCLPLPVSYWPAIRKKRTPVPSATVAERLVVAVPTSVQESGVKSALACTW